MIYISKAHFDCNVCWVNVGLDCRGLSGNWEAGGRLLQVSRGAMVYGGAQPKEAVVVEKREWTEDTHRR